MQLEVTVNNHRKRKQFFYDTYFCATLLQCKNIVGKKIRNTEEVEEENVE